MNQKWAKQVGKKDEEKEEKRGEESSKDLRKEHVYEVLDPSSIIQVCLWEWVCKSGVS